MIRPPDDLRRLPHFDVSDQDWRPWSRSSANIGSQIWVSFDGPKGINLSPTALSISMFRLQVNYTNLPVSTAYASRYCQRSRGPCLRLRGRDLLACSIPCSDVPTFVTLRIDSLSRRICRHCGVYYSTKLDLSTGIPICVVRVSLTSGPPTTIFARHPP